MYSGIVPGAIVAARPRYSDPRRRGTMYAARLISPLESGRAATTASPTAGCRTRAASISPSSTRNPRILTW